MGEIKPNVEILGQVFTPQSVAKAMLGLIKNNGRILEPSCGNGAFYKNLPLANEGVKTAWIPQVARADSRKTALIPQVGKNGEISNVAKNVNLGSNNPQVANILKTTEILEARKTANLKVENLQTAEVANQNGENLRVAKILKTAMKVGIEIDWELLKSGDFGDAKIVRIIKDSTDSTKFLDFRRDSADSVNFLDFKPDSAKLADSTDFTDSTDSKNSAKPADSLILNMDFFDFSIDEKFDSIIGNPPYVRYRDISPSTKSAINGFLENLEPENYADLAEFANLVDSTNPANPTNFANITNPQNQASLNNPTNLKTHTIATNLTTQKNSQSLFDERTNLYIFFIFKCVLHLKSGGELVFITPRDFLKSTSSRKLNEFLFAQGSITDFIDLGDRRIFAHATPNCAIWRFEKGNFTRDTNLLIFQDFSTFIKNTICKFTFLNGQIIFSKSDYSIPFYELFFVKVGAVSGADSIFGSEEFGDVDFVCSKTIKSGKTKKMIYGKSAENSPYLRKFKEVLMQRRIKKFSENNWFEWGRDYFKSDLPRIYVNTKTRHKKPFFIHDCKAYDGSILAIFPKFRADLATLQRVCAKLNALDWAELGFVCDGRFIFSQRSLENCHLDSSFAEFLNIISIN